MNFKRLLLLFAIFPCLFFTSCSKDASGSYTYKISGQVAAVPTESLNSATEEETTYFSLEPEFGQMNVAKGDNSGKVIVTFDNLIGEVCSTTATIDGCSITLDPGRKSIILEKILYNITATVDFMGSGQRTDNMLVIPIKYKGEFTRLGVSWTIVDSQVKCVAKSN